MKKNQLYRKCFKLRKHAEKGQYIRVKIQVKIYRINNKNSDFQD